jgi:alkylated DNA repair dioxygenase AlkB
LNNFGEIIVGISLNKEVKMKFENNQNKILFVMLPKRSLYCLKGEIRKFWKHSIPYEKYKNKIDDNNN